MIRNAVILGLKPSEVRAMIPRDFWLMVDGWNASHESNAVGANAPSMDEVLEMVEKYG